MNTAIRSRLSRYEISLLRMTVILSIVFHLVAIAVMNRYGLAKPGKRIVTINMVQAERPAPPKPKPQAASGGGQTAAQPSAQPSASPAPQAAASPAAAAARTAAIRQAVSKKGLLGVLGGRDVIRTRRTAESLDGTLAAGAAAGEGWGGGGGTGVGAGTGKDEWAGLTVDTKEVLSTEEKTVATATPRVAKLEQRKDAKVESVDNKQPQDLSTKEAVEVIKRTVETYLGGLRYTYNKALRKNPDLEGKITVAITINPQGGVDEAKVTETTMNAPEMEQEIVAKIRRWTFPAVAPKTLTVTYPFVFFPTM